MTQLTLKEQKARDRFCLAVDVADVNEAAGLVSIVRDYIGMVKIGKRLHTAAGKARVDIISGLWNVMKFKESSIFLDLKLHDTPSTVYDAAYEGTMPGVYMMDVHIAGGEMMCKKALEGVRESAAKQGIPTPKIIGVTVLTSLDDSDLAAQGLDIGYSDLVFKRAELGREWGLDGIVCPANKAGRMEQEFGSDWEYVTPGVQFAGLQGVGQKQLYTPAQAVQDCSSSKLVIGSAVRKAPNKPAVAYAILQSMAEYL